MIITRDNNSTVGLRRKYNQDSQGYVADVTSIEGLFNPLGDHVSLPLTGVVPLYPPYAATKLLIQALVENARYTLSGTTPVANLGFRLSAGSDPILIQVEAGQVIKVINEGSGTIIEIQWGA